MATQKTKTAKQSPVFDIGSVRSSDGTVLGYRRIGNGPGLILVHGAMMTSALFESLAGMLAGDFTVYLPDRRGRGMSGAFRENHDIQTEIDDLAALLGETNARNVFGLSSGAVISLHAAQQLRQITKLALYEPPLATASTSPSGWRHRYERELARGRMASAFATAMKGTGDKLSIAMLPRVLFVPLMALLLRMDNGGGGKVALRDLVPTVLYDGRIVRSAEHDVERFAELHCDTLLLGGTKSIGYLKPALERLATILPNARSVTLVGAGHTAAFNDDKPELVAAELLDFFR